MKKISIFLLLALAAQFSCQTLPVLAGEAEDRAEIGEIVKSFYESLAAGDFNSVMDKISPDYSADVKYDGYKDAVKKLIVLNSTTYFKYTIYDVKIAKLIIRDESATADVDFDWTGQDFKTLEKKSGSEKRAISFSKKNGAWKIVSVVISKPKTSPFHIRTNQ